MNNDCARIGSALSFIPPEDRDLWVRMGMAIKSELGEGGFRIWDAWSRQADSYRERDARDVWKSISAGKVTIGTLFHLAKQNGWRPGKDPAFPSRSDIEQWRKDREAQRLKEQDQTAVNHEKQANRAMSRWLLADPCTDHPYLSRKHVKSYGLRVGTWEKWSKDDAGEWSRIATDGALLVPMFDQNSKLWNLQAIFPEIHPTLGRDKDFLPGRKADLFFVIGESTDTILIAEGYATGATVHECTGHQTFIAFDCGNLISVALTVRAMHPGKRIILCADNDRETHGNPGVTKANAAAKAVGGLVSVPKFPNGVPGTDFNDLRVYCLNGDQL